MSQYVTYVTKPPFSKTHNYIAIRPFQHTGGDEAGDNGKAEPKENVSDSYPGDTVCLLITFLVLGFVIWLTVTVFLPCPFDLDPGATARKPIWLVSECAAGKTATFLYIIPQIITAILIFCFFAGLGIWALAHGDGKSFAAGAWFGSR